MNTQMPRGVGKASGRVYFLHPFRCLNCDYSGEGVHAGPNYEKAVGRHGPIKRYCPNCAVGNCPCHRGQPTAVLMERSLV